MRALSRSGFLLALSALGLLTAGCGDSGTTGEHRDADVDHPVSIGPPPPDGPGAAAEGPSSAPDLPTSPDTHPGSMDAPAALDLAFDSVAIGSDGPASIVDGANVRLDTALGEVAGLDLGQAKLDGGSGTDTVAPPDAPTDTAADGFTPGPATPIVVNSGNTATYNVGDGTWKLFSFDATAGQLYSISELSGIVRGYVGTSAAVSPGNFQYATDATTGTLAFTAATTQRYFIAVAASGGGASGSFQVADGGQLLALGTTAVKLPAPAADNYYYFRFPISSGHAYTISLAGPSTPSVGLAVSPHAERASNGQFSMGPWGMSSSLPITNEAIAADSVAQSYSGYYFFFVRVPSPIDVAITLTQTS